jgi:hypothetical protein
LQAAWLYLMFIGTEPPWNLFFYYFYFLLKVDFADKKSVENANLWWIWLRCLPLSPDLSGGSRDTPRATGCASLRYTASYWDSLILGSWIYLWRPFSRGCQFQTQLASWALRNHPETRYTQITQVSFQWEAL